MISPEQISLPDEFILEEPNPYRRRQKVIGIRRREGRAAHLAKAGILGALWAAVLLGAGYWIGRAILISPVFLLRPDQDVKLTGNRIVSTDDVLNALGFGDALESAPVSLFRVNLTTARHRVKSIPWIESATVTRDFPNHLDINVVERTPVAYAHVGGRIELVDKNGVFLQMLQKTPVDFPVLYGLDSAVSMDQRKEMLARYEQFVTETRDEVPGSGWSISEADLSYPDDLRVLLVQGRVTILVHFGDRDYRQRFKTFVKVAPHVLADTPRVDSMDMRYRGEVVVEPVEESVASKSEVADSSVAAPKPSRPKARRARHAARALRRR